MNSYGLSQELGMFRALVHWFGNKCLYPYHLGLLIASLIDAVIIMPQYQWRNPGVE